MQAPPIGESMDGNERNPNAPAPRIGDMDGIGGCSS